MRSKFDIVDRNVEHNIVFIEDDCDANGDAIMTVTNDAENVLEYFQRLYGKNVRIVYRDTEMEWWEIVTNHKTWMGSIISFKPWHGLAWDILKK
jgi:hypothetical protein